MLKKSLIAIATGILCSLSIPDLYAHEVEFKVINQQKVFKTMYEAVPYTQFMQIGIGSNADNVGGFEQDERHTSSGLPMAFRPTNNPDEAWILDAINDSLKLFKSGKLIRKINLDKMGYITDFAMNKSGQFAFLNQQKGNIYITDSKGEIKATLTGFENALSLEFSSEKELLVKSPMAGGVIRVSTEGTMLGLYEGNQSLSNYTSEMGLWGLECSGGTIAKLFVIEPSQDIIPKKRIVAEFPFADYKDVEYKGGGIYGFDAEGNIYFGLVACDPDGIIYRDRIYKCNQDGKVLKEMDVTGLAVRSPDLPRHRVVWSEDKVMTFYSDELKNYYLEEFNLK